MTRARLLDGLTLGVLVTLLAATGYCFDALPDRIATHFDASGTPTSWAPRAIGAWLDPAFAVALVLALRGAVLLVAEEKRQRVNGVMRIAALGMAVVFALTQAMTLKAATAAGGELSAAIWVPILLAMVGVPVAVGAGAKG